ncbi:DUF2244 domain-containing protein [Noviherbaspirillum massiliense]|uniref:DUF2244 domain-containing protein n=1 Tax=Noviherbaspirillum massiliense TaxID=1465823 RepID=UPI000310D572|nr:DUF2244 domain-containing protein [Noviherbaspirillum massiliense]
MDKNEWTLKRNCSLSPRQLAGAYAILCLMSFIVAAACLLTSGVWQVLAFAILEMAGVALAFLQYARHATDHEHIALLDGCLLIERVEAGHTKQTRLEPCWLRITLPSRSQDLICLESRGVKVEVGRFVPAAKRWQVGLELRQMLQGGLASS